MKQDNGIKITKMHHFWQIVWAVWFVGWVALEVGNLSNLVKDHYFLWWFLLFLPLEIQGAARTRWAGVPGFKTKLGDTLSEFIWSATRQFPARHKFSQIIGWSLAARAYSLAYLFDDRQWGWQGADWQVEFLVTIPWLLFCVGLGRWLGQHFPDEGVTG